MLLLCLQAGVLLRMAWEDWRERSLYAFWFPVLVLLLAIQLFPSHLLPADFLINTGVLFLQGVGIICYIRLAKGVWVNLVKGWLGWGDIVMLLILAWYLSVPVFILFQVFSLLTLLIIHVIRLRFYSAKTATLPLAGHQALCLLILLLIERYAGASFLQNSDFFLSYILQ